MRERHRLRPIGLIAIAGEAVRGRVPLARFGLRRVGVSEGIWSSDRARRIGPLVIDPYAGDGEASLELMWIPRARREHHARQWRIRNEVIAPDGFVDGYDGVNALGHVGCGCQECFQHSRVRQRVYDLMDGVSSREARIRPFECAWCHEACHDWCGSCQCPVGPLTPTFDCAEASWETSHVNDLCGRDACIEQWLARRYREAGGDEPR